MRIIERIERGRVIRCAVSAVLLASASLVAAQDTGSLQEATMIAEQLVAQRVDPLAAALTQVETSRIALAVSSPAIVREEEPGEVTAYAESLVSLGRYPKPETLNALTVAVEHQEPTVRLAALTALREGASQGQPQSAALLAARSMITADTDPGIRRAAFEAYCRWGDQDDVLALSQALGRQPGPVRDLAVREWLRIERERQ